MSIFKTKSNDNLSAATFLQSQELYGPSIHCLYYSCLQISKHILNANGISYNIQGLKKEAGSHNYIIIETKKYASDPQEYNRDMRNLKALRVRADYENSTINLNDANKALDLANRTRKLLGL